MAGPSYAGMNPNPVPGVKKGSKIQYENPGPEFPKGGDGGWYELSNGEKVQGEDDAIIAEAEIRKAAIEEGAAAAAAKEKELTEAKSKADAEAEAKAEEKKAAKASDADAKSKAKSGDSDTKAKSGS